MTVRFPYAGDSIIAHSVLFQVLRAYAAGYCGMFGMVPTWGSASSVAISAGYWRNAKVKTTYAGGTLTGIAPASAGCQRIDLIGMDGADNTIKAIAGTEDTPPSPGTGFFDQIRPVPPNLPSDVFYLIAAILIDENGIVTTDHGVGTPKYAIKGVADLRVLDPAYDHGDLDGRTDDDHTQYVLRSLFTEQGDMAQRGASVWEATPHGAANQRWVCGGHGANNAWATGVFGVNFPFGNGSAVLTAEAQGKRIPPACKITKAYIRSTKGVDGDMLAGSITVTIYIHDGNVDADSVAASDTFSLVSASYYAETGLSIAVAAGKYITAIISGISTCKCVTLDLELEAT